MKTLHESPSTSAEHLTNSDIDGVQLVRDFRFRQMAAVSDDSKSEEPLSDEELMRVRAILKKNKGVRHLSADDLGWSITRLDRVITTHKLEK